jgi:polysaccharide deacetylase 2 family uncharacterized protein YibQ
MPPKKKAPARGKAGKPAKGSGDRLHLRVALALLFVFGFLVVSLVGLSYLRESVKTASPPLPFEEAPPAGRDREVAEDIRVELESALLRSGVALADVEARPAAEGRVRMEVRGKFPSPAVLAELERRLARLDPQIRLAGRPAMRELDIVWRGTPVFSLHFQPPVQAHPPAPKPAIHDRAKPDEPFASHPEPRLAIVMDDLGLDVASGQALVAIDLPVTFAIMPGNPHAREVADLAHGHGREVLVHMPMEPQGYPAVNPGNDALLVRMERIEIEERVRRFLERVPHAVGGNNHMGSRFTESAEGMGAVMAVLKEADLFFLDSLTTAGSVGAEEARQAGVPAGVRDLFLDNEQDVHRIAAEIRHLVRVARRQGQAIGICHPYPETLEALRRETAALKESGVEVVPVSRLIR